MGVVGLLSGNNVLYLIESFLLSGMILSGVLSERSVSAVSLQIRRISATAGEPALDQITLTNNRRITLFCIEAGEWVDGKFVELAFISRLGPKCSVTVPSRAVYPKRGISRWDATAVATSYPFGFARKVKILDREGSRLVWPARDSAVKDQTQSRQLTRSPGGDDFSDGEVRPMVPGDDFGDVVWTVSSKGEDFYVRPRQSKRPSREVLLDLRSDSDDAFERLIRQTAQSFHLHPQARYNAQALSTVDHDCRLIVLDHDGKRLVQGRKPILNWLATAQAAGRGAAKRWR
jgi:uncharacterized protein (DUF58 family)